VLCSLEHRRIEYMIRQYSGVQCEDNRGKAHSKIMLGVTS